MLVNGQFSLDMILDIVVILDMEMIFLFNLKVIKPKNPIEIEVKIQRIKIQRVNERIKMIQGMNERIIGNRRSKMIQEVNEIIIKRLRNKKIQRLRNYKEFTKNQNIMNLIMI